jgi:hypothetical protein
MSKSYLPSIEEYTNVDDYPFLDAAGIQLVKELDWQIMENPNWSHKERVWLGTMRNLFLSSAISMQDAIKESYLRGVEFSHNELFGNENEL